ncbi:hypothetical protein KP509_31G038300 [Ceratopteris richardii]|uniref:RCK N-terminal domain-containing protein n=1 Tax=Ceratopteris richardii TaxID=49495 RepID=A0A8T2QX82_CERRI|nr:hypothetical protein KP509_31G038300 [Ceratopteris richardii]
MTILGGASSFLVLKPGLSLQSEFSKGWREDLVLHNGCLSCSPRSSDEATSSSYIISTGRLLRRCRQRIQARHGKVGRSLPLLHSGTYLKLSNTCCFNIKGNFLNSSQTGKSSLISDLCTDSFNEQSKGNVFIGQSRKWENRFVAFCGTGDGSGTDSSTERSNSNNGHASSFDRGNGYLPSNSVDDTSNPSFLENIMPKVENGNTKEESAQKQPSMEDDLSVEYLREVYESAVAELELARSNSSKLEEEAQTIAEKALSLRDEASEAESKAEKSVAIVERLSEEEVAAVERLAEERLRLAEAEENVIQVEKILFEAKEAQKERKEGSFMKDMEEDSEETPTQDGSLSVSHGADDFVAPLYKDDKEPEDEALRKEEEALKAAQEEVKNRVLTVSQYEKELSHIQTLKVEHEKEALRAKEAAMLARDLANVADEEVAQAMSLAEQAVASELDAEQNVRIAEMALQKAEKVALEVTQTDLSAQPGDLGGIEEDAFEKMKDLAATEALLDGPSLDRMSIRESTDSRDDRDAHGSTELEQKVLVSASLETSGTVDITVKKLEVTVLQEVEGDKLKVGSQQKKENVKDPSSTGIPKTFTKRSSRFFPASFFSSNDEDEEFTLTTVFRGVKEHFLKVTVGALLVFGGLYLKNRMSSQTKYAEQTEYVTSFEDVTTTAKPVVRELQKLPRRIQKILEKIPHQEVDGEEASLFDVLWLLLASVIFVPIFQKLPGGSPVLGYLAAGVLIGPYSLSFIRHVHGTKAIAEFGVVFLLFNIGLELSVERLSSMKKYVFGLGTSQVLITAAVVGVLCHYVFGFSGPAALVVGNGLALSSTAVVLQVLQERGENTSRHGRATFSVLLFQDLAVVVLLILLPLISPTSSKGGVGFQAIAEALGVAAVKGVVAIAGIIAGGRLLLRPIYRRMADNHNAEIFAANTLFVVLGTSVLTARAGLSMALGAFLAGLLLAETEFALQVESDIAPYRGLLLGLFFMTVGMAIDPKLFISKFPIIMGALSLLIIGKTALVTLVGRLFGLSTVAAVRAGLLLAPGGEFAFVAFGEAVNQRIMTSNMSSLLFLVVGLSMALTPWLGALGQFLATQFEQQDVRSLLPAETETDDLQDHIIICGFGRVGQIIAQLLSVRLIPFVALDVRSERVSAGRALDLPVYFGDAGSKEVLHKLGAHRASSAVIALDTPGANFRAVWALSKHFPNVKTFVRAHDVEHGINLEKAGATAVVPETLEPSLQLAAAVLAQAKLPATEIAATIDEFRSKHMSELTELCEISGSCLGYGYSRIMNKPKSQPESLKVKAEDDLPGETRQEAIAIP